MKRRGGRFDIANKLHTKQFNNKCVLSVIAANAYIFFQYYVIVLKKY